MRCHPLLAVVTIFKQRDIMKKSLMLSIALFYLSIPCLCSADYVINLKNGGRFSTTYYWEEGNLLKFYSQGGTVGVEKDNIIEIIEDTSAKNRGHEIIYNDLTTDKSENIDSEVKNKKEIFTRHDKKSTIIKEETIKEDKNEEKEEIDKKYYKSKLLSIKIKIEGFLQEYRDASRSKNPTVKKAAQNKMRKASKHLFDLQDELQAKNKGVLPEWWQKL